MSQAQKNQFEQQYNEALNGDDTSNKVPHPASNKIKDPEDWTTGNEPMTEAQRSYLENLMELHGEKLDNNLTKAEAASLIDQKKQNITIPAPNGEAADFWQESRDPDNWRTGDEPATGAQLSYLQTLARELGEKPGENLSKAEASKEIEALQKRVNSKS